MVSMTVVPMCTPKMRWWSTMQAAVPPVVPGIQNQLALGLSGRAEYVMPFFTIGVGLGTNVLGRGDLRGLYQVFALKINVTRSSFLHIGYNLQDFQTPNYLMLGLGFRFNNKYPKVRH